MPTKRRKFADFLEFHISPEDSHWISDGIIKGRRIALRGIRIAVSQNAGKVEISPSIPCLGPAMRLLKWDYRINDITFDRETQTWHETTDEENVSATQINGLREALAKRVSS